MARRDRLGSGQTKRGPGSVPVLRGKDRATSLWSGHCRREGVADAIDYYVSECTNCTTCCPEATE